MDKDKGKRETQEQLGRRQAARGRHLAGRSAWLYIERLGPEDAAEGSIAIETSLLPDTPEIAGPLAKVGFRRDGRGGFRAVVLVGDAVGLARAVAAFARVAGEEVSS